MHVGKIHTYENIVYHNETVAYYYNVKPINSLFASDLQKSTLLENLKDKILSINMPGQIIIRPVAINGKKIINAYKECFVKYGCRAFSDLAKRYIEDIKKINCTETKYRYELYLVFTDGREELKRKHSLRLFGKSNDAPDKDLLDIFKIADAEIYKKLSVDLSVTRLNDIQCERLHNYLAIPVESRVIDYYVEEQPTHIKYAYKTLKSEQYNELYCKTMIASKFEKRELDDSSKANSVVNSLQLLPFPTDVVVKFDLEHTKEFVNEMIAKKEQIKKANRRYAKTAEKNDKDAQKSMMMAISGEKVDESLERSKIRWQMFLRVRAVTSSAVEKRCDLLREKFKGSKILLSNEIGEQVKIADNLFPYRSSFKRYVQLSDIAYFVHYNFLGGLFIGEEEEGIILTYTQPGKLPVFYDISKPLLGKTKTTASTSIAVGSTGGGKTQLVDHEAFVHMIFKNMRILTFDPKGDRKKKIKMLGDNASHLEIGSPECMNGMFDAYLLHPDDELEAIRQAKIDVNALARALDKTIKINFHHVDKAYEMMKQDLRNHKIKQLTFTELTKKLYEYDPYLADQLSSLKKDPIGRLFFAKQDSKLDTAFNLTKPYNLVTFSKVPVYNEKKEVGAFNPNELEHNLFAIVMSKASDIANSFMKSFDGEGMIIMDEWKVWMSIPGGLQVGENLNRMCRAFQKHLRIISQSLSDVPASILQNTGQMFIGSLASSEEIDFVLKELKLGEHSVIRNVIQDYTTEEGVSPEKSWNFLFKDYNNRKCITKLIIPEVFFEAFRTLKDEESS